MDNDGIKIVRKKHSFGIIEYHYKNDQLIEKIDYSTRNPWLWKYDSKGELVSLTVLQGKSHKKLWMSTIGTLLIISLLCSKSCSTNKIKHNEHNSLSNIQHTR